MSSFPLAELSPERDVIIWGQANRVSLMLVVEVGNRVCRLSSPGCAA